MSKPGNYTAYQQYKPLDNGTTQALQHWSNFAEQKRQNDVANQQKDKTLQNEANKEKQANLDKWLSYDSIPMTGVENVDMAHAKIAASDRVELQKLVGQLVNVDPFSEKGLTIKMQIDKIQKNPAVIKGMVSAPLKLAQEYISGVGTKYVKTPENDNFFANLKDAKFTRNENGDPAFIIKDPKDDTKEIVLTEAEILNLQQVSPLIPKFNWEKMVKENAEILNEKPHSITEQDEVTGFLTTTEGYNETTVATIAKNMFSDTNGKPTEYAISFLAQKGIYDIGNLSEGTLQELQQQFVTDITPFLVNKKGLKTNTLELQRQKNETTAQYQRRMAGVAERNANTKIEIGIGSGKMKNPVTMTDFVQVTVPRADGKVLFNVKSNALIVNYGQGENEMQRNVTGVLINPNDPNDITISYIESGKRLNGRRIEPYNEQKSYNTKTDGEMAGTFSAEFGQTLEQLNANLKKKAGIKEKPAAKPKPKPKPAAKAKPTETPQQRIERLKRERGLK